MIANRPAIRQKLLFSLVILMLALLICNILLLRA
jgi:hypothetical protein